MEPRKYCVDDKLVIKSDKENMQRVYAIVIGMIGVVVCWVLSFGDDYFSYVIMAIPLILLGWAALTEWVSTNRVFIMEQEGCTVCFYGYKKFYLWNEFAVKRWENYTRYSYLKLPSGSDGKGYYREGVFFSKYSVNKSDSMTPMEYMLCRPMTSFCVNFYPEGITEGHGDYKSCCSGDFLHDIFYSNPRKLPEVYPVEKEVFVNYMKLWNVDIEGLSMDTDHIKYV